MAGRSFKKPRILLAEDDKSITEVLNLLLKDDYEVISPISYKELDACVSKQKFDLVFLDVSLWGNDCTQLVHKLRSHKENKNIPLVLLSARSDLHIIASKISANGVIEKPFEVDLLLDTINKLLPASV